MAVVTTCERSQGVGCNSPKRSRQSAFTHGFALIAATLLLILTSYFTPAKAGWQVCFTFTGYVGNYISGCRGNFATAGECQSARASLPLAEQQNSYCTGSDGTIGGSGTGNTDGRGNNCVADTRTTKTMNQMNSLSQQGKQLMAQGNCREAADVFAKGVSLFNSLSQCWRSALSNEHAVRDLEKARACVKKGGAEENGRRINEEGVRLYQRGECADAIEKYQNALKLIPKDKVIRNNLASAKACLATQKARKSNEEGHARWKSCDIFGAIAKYQHALELTPSDDASSKNLAAAKRELKEATTPASFLDAYDYAVVTDTGEPWCSYDGIRRYLIAHDPNNGQWRALAANEEGLALLDANDFSGAIAKFRLARDLLPTDKVIRQNLARAESWSKEQEGRKLFQRGDYAGALAKYREGLKLDPENATIKNSVTEAEKQQRVSGTQDPSRRIDNPIAPNGTTSSPVGGEGTGSLSSERFCGFFGTAPCSTQVNVGPVRTGRVVHAGKAMEELSMMITANQSAAGLENINKPNRMRYEAECGYDSSNPLNCGALVSHPLIPEPPNPTREYSSEVKVLIESLEKIPQARDNEEINDNLKKLDDNVRLRDLIDSQRERIQKQLDEGKGDLKSLADEKRKLDADREHTVQGIEVGKKKIDEVLLDLGAGSITKPND